MRERVTKRDSSLGTGHGRSRSEGVRTGQDRQSVGPQKESEESQGKEGKAHLSPCLTYDVGRAGPFGAWRGIRLLPLLLDGGRSGGGTGPRGTIP